MIGHDRRRKSRVRAALLHAVSLALLLLAAMSSAAPAVDFSDVPGTVISYYESPDWWEKLTNDETYISSPSIAVMPNGDYVASHDLFGSGVDDEDSGTTKVFYSSNKGTSWTSKVTLGNTLRASLFTFDGDLYLLGYTSTENGSIIVRKSTDNGATWTTPSNSTNGLILTGDYGGSPCRPVEYNGRLWIAQGARMISAPLQTGGSPTNLLNSASWTLSSAAPSSSHSTWLDGTFTFWSEGQVVASPQTGAVVMPKIDQLPYTGLIRCSDDGSTLSFDPDADFAALPGAEKKFGATYDPVSQKFYALSNPVLPIHEGVTTPALTRNTAAVLSSRDLYHWDVEKIFLYSSHIDNGDWGEGFQYFNFAIDDSSMAIVSRTAFDVGGGEEKPPRGHDSNLMTCHRISNFRTIAPDQYLMADTDNNQVLRYERTRNTNSGGDAPLGKFTLGSTFGGSALNQPTSLAQDTSGYVYVREQSGRILRFDALGNFIAVVGSSPAAFQGAQMDVAQPAYGERAWIQSGAGQWNDPTNWYYWGRPDTNYELANFGSAATAARTVTLDESYTVKGLRFRNANKYTLAGAGDLTIEAESGRGDIEAAEGNHDVQLACKLNSDTDYHAASGASLRFQGPLDLNGRQLYVGGQGGLDIDGSQFAMHGGELSLNGSTAVTFGGASSVTFDGTLVVNSTLDIAGYHAYVDRLVGSGTITNSSASSRKSLYFGYDNQDGTYSGSVEGGAGGYGIRLYKQGTGRVVLNGIISGANTKVTVNEGTLQLGNAGNTYGGGTEVYGGVLSVSDISDDASSNIGGFTGDTSGYVLLAGGGTFQYNGPSTSTSRRLAVNTGDGDGGGVFDITQAGTTLTWTPNGGTRDTDLVKTGAGKLVMAGSWGGSATVTVNAGTLELSGANTFTGGVDVKGGSTLVVSAISDVAGQTSNIGTAGGSANYLTVSQGSTLRYTGPTASTARRWWMDEGAGGIFDITDDAATLTLSGSGGHTASLIKTGAGGLAVSSSLTGTGGATVTIDAGTLTLTSGGNTYNGGTTVNGGTLRVGNNAALGSGVVTLYGGALSSNGTTARTLANSVTFGGNATLGSATDNGTLNFSGPGTLTGTRNLTVASAVNYAGAIGGSYGLNKYGAGTLTLSGSNSFTGGLEIRGGVVSVGTIANSGINSNIGAGNTIGIRDATFMYTGGTASMNRRLYVDVGSGATIDVVNPDTTLTWTPSGGNRLLPLAKTGAGGLSFNGLIKGTASVTVNGGTLTLGAANTYSGDTTVNAGALILGSGGSILMDVNPTGDYSQFLGAGMLNLNGTIKLDVTDVTGAAGSWMLVDVDHLTESYGATFAVAMADGSPFTQSADVWTYVAGGELWSFSEPTGTLTLGTVPEPGTLAILLAGMIGWLAYIWRKRK